MWDPAIQPSRGRRASWCELAAFRVSEGAETTRRGAGFTLLEVLVAFVIMSLVLVSLLQGGTTGMSNVEAANLTERAVAIAQSSLSGFDSQSSHAAEDLQGNEGDYHWRLHVVPIQSIAVRPEGRSHPEPTVLYQVAVTVSWLAHGRPSAVRLDTMRLTPVPPTLP